VAYLYYKNLWSSENLKLKTKSGIKNYQLLKRAENTFWFLAELGKPKFDLPSNSLSKISSEVKAEAKVSSFPILLPREGLIIEAFFVDVGNPVVCIFVKDFAPFTSDFGAFDWQLIGQRIESTEEMFPARTNIVFIKTIDHENVEIRIWERGAGETASSGTCSIAAAVTSAFTEKTERKVSVHAEGGTTEAVWREDGEMLITGRADLAFCGEWFGK
jgi:diaminopimelate epimerase